MTSIPNIGPREARRRRRFGLVALALSIGAAVLFVALGVGSPWRLVFFLAFFLAGVGLFQAQGRT